MMKKNKQTLFESLKNELFLHYSLAFLILFYIDFNLRFKII